MANALPAPTPAQTEGPAFSWDAEPEGNFVRLDKDAKEGRLVVRFLGEPRLVEKDFAGNGKPQTVAEIECEYLGDKALLSLTSTRLRNALREAIVDRKFEGKTVEISWNGLNQARKYAAQVFKLTTPNSKLPV